jgi:hypothetical protein
LFHAGMILPDDQASWVSRRDHGACCCLLTSPSPPSSHPCGPPRPQRRMLPGESSGGQVPGSYTVGGPPGPLLLHQLSGAPDERPHMADLLRPGRWQQGHHYRGGRHSQLDARRRPLRLGRQGVQEGVPHQLDMAPRALKVGSLKAATR